MDSKKRRKMNKGFLWTLILRRGESEFTPRELIGEATPEELYNELGVSDSQFGTASLDGFPLEKVLPKIYYYLNKWADSKKLSRRELETKGEKVRIRYRLTQKDEPVSLLGKCDFYARGSGAVTIMGSGGALLGSPSLIIPIHSRVYVGMTSRDSEPYRPPRFVRLDAIRHRESIELLSLFAILNGDIALKTKDRYKKLYRDTGIFNDYSDYKQCLESVKNYNWDFITPFDWRYRFGISGVFAAVMAWAAIKERDIIGRLRIPQVKQGPVTISQVLRDSGIKRRSPDEKAFRKYLKLSQIFERGIHTLNELIHTQKGEELGILEFSTASRSLASIFGRPLKVVLKGGEVDLEESYVYPPMKAFKNLGVLTALRGEVRPYATSLEDMIQEMSSLKWHRPIIGELKGMNQLIVDRAAEILFTDEDFDSLHSDTRREFITLMRINRDIQRQLGLSSVLDIGPDMYSRIQELEKRGVNLMPISHGRGGVYLYCSEIGVNSDMELRDDEFFRMLGRGDGQNTFGGERMQLSKDEERAKTR